MAKITILREDIDPKVIQLNTLTSDCKFVQRLSGAIDLVKAYKAVDVFDYYYDRLILIKRIWHAGGSRNPKFQQPELQFTFGKSGYSKDRMAIVMASSWATTISDSLDNLKTDYRRGKLTMRELMDRVDLGPDANYEDYCEIFDSLLE